MLLWLTGSSKILDSNVDVGFAGNNAKLTCPLQNGWSSKAETGPPWYNLVLWTALQRTWCYRLLFSSSKTLKGTMSIIDTDELYTEESIKIHILLGVRSEEKTDSTTRQFSDVHEHRVPKTNQKSKSSALVWVRHSAPPHSHRPLVSSPLPQWCGTLSTVKGIETGDWTKFSFLSVKWIQHRL